MVFRGALLFAVVFAAVVMLGGVVIAVAVAVHMALVDVLPPAAALLAASVIPLAVGLAGLIVIPKLMQWREPRRTLTANENLMAELGNLAGARFSHVLGTHPRKTAMASLLAGFAVGASPELRRALMNLMKT
jgi:hypothetical protein